MLLLLLHLSDAACSEAHKLLATIKEDLQTQMQGQEICQVRTIEETRPEEAVTSSIRERFWARFHQGGMSDRHISSGTCHNSPAFQPPHPAHGLDFMLGCEAGQVGGKRAGLVEFADQDAVHTIPVHPLVDQVLRLSHLMRGARLEGNAQCGDRTGWF